ncbi:MAG: HlyC/CorC family transporter [Planctomycetes bacterium]|nr:HlyC/CorC family transporter [Planctomycetota bacterium]
MIFFLAAAETPTSLPPSHWLQDDWTALGIACLLLLLSGSLALLRASLARSHRARVLAITPEGESRNRLETLLARADSLITSASLLKKSCDLVFIVLVLDAFARRDMPHWLEVIGALVVAVPVIFLFTESLPAIIARRHGDAMLVRALPVFHLVQLPLFGVVAALEWSRRALMRMFGIEEDPRTSRELVEGLRDVVEDAGRKDGLDDVERELIENVIEFGAVDVAAVMTPRTEVHGIEVSEGLRAAIALAALEGHSRIPVYRDTIDTIIGSISARGVVGMLASEDLETAKLEDYLQPAYFVPETKSVAELLKEFRQARQKMAIVLDEYGGTAGLVTLGDVLGEIVGEIQESFDHEEPDEVRHVAPGVTDVDASLHVSDVNEALGLELPEEADFETLGGFVLSELGHFPKSGQRFEWKGVQFEVREASDRRVITVRVTREVNDANDREPKQLSQRAG